MSDYPSTTPTLVKLFECETCGGEHEGTLAHRDQWSGRQLWSVICPTDDLTEWLNDEWPNREVAKVETAVTSRW